MSKSMNEGPCPCGSGTRHDECCGPIRRGPLERFTEDDLRQAMSLAVREIERPEYESWHAGAAQEFFGAWLDAFTDLDPDDDDDFDLHDAHSTAFSTWTLFDRPLDDGTRPVERMLERRGSKLLPGVRNALSALSSTRLQLLEIVELRRGSGMLVQDVFDGARMWISEPSAGEAELETDVLLARVFRDSRGVRSFLPDARCFEGGWKEHLRKAVTELRGEPGLADCASETEFWKRIGPELHELWCEWAHEAEDSSADELGIHRATYRIVDAEAFEDVLDESGVFAESDEDEWVWQSSQRLDQHGFGSLKREGELLYLVTLMQSTLEELRECASEEFGAAIEFVRTEKIELEAPDARHEAGA